MYINPKYKGQKKGLFHIEDKSYFDIPAISHSKLKRNYNGNRPSKESKSLSFGSLVHDLFASDSLFEEKYQILKNTDGRKAETKKEIADIVESGKIPVSQEEYDNALTCIRNIKNHDVMKEILQRPHYHEVTVLGSDFGVQCKGKIDLLVENEDGTYDLIDLKTSRNITPREFLKDQVRFGTDSQLSFYQGLLRDNNLIIRNVYVLGVDTETHKAGLFLLSQGVLGNGRNKLSRMMKELLRVNAVGVDNQFSGVQDWLTFEEQRNKEEIEALDANLKGFVRLCSEL